MIDLITEKNKDIKITSYYIDDNNTLHTYIGDLKHITISDVKTDKRAEYIINEMNKGNINW